MVRFAGIPRLRLLLACNGKPLRSRKSFDERFVLGVKRKEFGLLSQFEPRELETWGDRAPDERPV
jgi:hypothetical protein